MIEHLNDYNKILADLQKLEVEILDEDKVLLLLNSLPNAYDHLITTLLYEKDEIRFDDVSNALVNNEYRKKGKQTHRGSSSEALTVRGMVNNEYCNKDKQTHRGSSSEALTVRGTPESKKSSNKGSNMGCSHSRSRRALSSDKIARDECAYCHKKGHRKKYCLTLQKHNRDTNNSQANLAHLDDEDSNQALLGLSLVCQAVQWIMDSGCTYHMCSNKDWFSRMDIIDGGAVFMGNDHACKTHGVGKIRLKLHDGSIRVLTEVWYVPDLKKNLISLGTLDSKGYRITLEGGILKVGNGARLVMKGTWQNNLYFLQGSTIVGGAATASSNVGKDTLDTTSLWHMRLGDAGDKAMQDNSCMLNSSAIARRQQFLIRALGGYYHNQTHHQLRMQSMISGSGLEDDDLGNLRSITRPLDPTRYKGHTGKIAVIGGCREYTDCFRDEDKKSISERVLAEVEKWMERFDCLVVGPGLGRDPFLLDCVSNIIKQARHSSIPIVIDADGLFLVTNNLDLVSGYPLAILTPNINEYKRLVQSVLNCEVNDQDAPGQLLSLAKRIGGVTILRKGKSDLVSDGNKVMSVSMYGSPRRCGGQGDILSGSVAVFVSWARQYISSAKEELGMNPTVLGCIAGSALVRKAASLAFENKRRSTLTGDIIECLGRSLEEICPVSCIHRSLLDQ
ncbi:uncharacterized protein LOC131309885 isoform X3 [Rhododendron vialii]|uniref:uncharacterized protein LOC131309885 isoform X3 n=1 Tax=Rhododendron vialii TaxID=182163 RepID=UPI00265E9E40|nr:uncharacterized protein LOC131309885 isoform X3 [Rhododendron vialii]